MGGKGSGRRIRKGKINREVDRIIGSGRRKGFGCGYGWGKDWRRGM
ncbi:hypothetical protein [Cytobacillus oceanisediminis]|nr:hypothetical protein [Cytobacillus oceanisediminis]